MIALSPTPALAAMRRSVEDALKVHSVAQVLSRRLLHAVYQPIVALKDGAVVAHEALIRGPADSDLHGPDALFAAARTEGLGLALEQACLRQALRQWTPHGQDRRLFVNLSAQALAELVQTLTPGGLMHLLQELGVAPAALVVEITEHERVADLPRLIEATTALRAQGVRFALDDFGDGRSSLRLWAELRPELVKIDKYFVHDLDREAVKVQTLKGLARFAETFCTALVAEGIETEAELQVVRDLGIELGQGWLLGRPAVDPATAVLPRAAAIIASSQIAVLPELKRAAGADFTVERLSIQVPPIAPDTPIDELARRFAADTLLRGVALVEGDRPVGLINRQSFVDRYAKPFFKELYGRKPVSLFANATPLMLDRHTGLDAMTAVLTSSDQRYLTEGFIVTEGGRYLGLGTGEQLVRVVTEVRIEAARHANPLTFLPGNIPISEHIARLLASGGEFVACYGDLNDFKPYNDHYGYWRGDEMIRLAARTLISHCDPRRDFVGHVGGDDFVVLFQSDDWMARCERIVDAFNLLALELYDVAALERGGIEADDRQGIKRFFGFTTLSIGAVPVRPGLYARADQVASAAAMAKHQAKQSKRGLAVEQGAPR
ncbi:Diguanylate phosphodiesterase [Rubrivivax sp. A210]|uniref:GGDEF domain-containing protein n=1 Tax=Rubrivivax sp. A210 TaxID=2772301 RepID=UPI00198C58BC|nr:GGDEF domain-containing protein [Rubrivivax sp. A210]CAD5371289.1 Diguanylate phosphodiesterase [Rubrivivax sp. A210]